MSVKEEAELIIKGVAKELASILVPPKKDEQPMEYMELHYCEKCQAYHKAKK